MTKTKLRTVSMVDDVRAVLNNSILRRELSIGSDWNKIRVGIRFNFTDGGVTTSGNPELFIGVCSGTTYPWNNGAGTTLNAVGLRANKTDDWSYNAAVPPTPAFYSLLFQKWVPTKRIGTTITDTTYVYNDTTRWSADHDVSNALFVDITKGEPNYTVDAFVRQIVTSFSVTKELFAEQVGIELSAVTNHGFTTPRAFAVSEADGVFDSVCVSWDRGDPELEISDLAIVRFS